MKDFTKGILAACAVALVCREAYAKGYNKSNRDLEAKMDLVKSTKEAVINEKGKS